MSSKRPTAAAPLLRHGAVIIVTPSRVRDGSELVVGRRASESMSRILPPGEPTPEGWRIAPPVKQLLVTDERFPDMI
jgi:hypothetical protein